MHMSELALTLHEIGRASRVTTLSLRARVLASAIARHDRAAAVHASRSQKARSLIPTLERKARAILADRRDG